MATNIGPRIGIDGEKEYRDAISSLIQQGKTLDAEMRAVAAAFDGQAASEKDAERQTDLLNQRIQTQKDYVKQLSDMVARSTEQTGENSTQTLKWREALANAETQLTKLETSADTTGSEVSELGGEMDAAGDQAEVFGGQLQSNLEVQAIVDGLGDLVGAIKKVGGAMVDTVKESAAYADNILTLSTKTGLSTDTLQEFKYMAELTDTSVETITGSLTKLTKNMDAARSGSGSAADAFKALGVDVTGANGELRDNEDVFYDVIDALGRMDNATERDATAMAIFGKSAQELNSLIAQGSEGIAAYAREAHDMGYVLDGETLSSLGAADDAFQRLDLMVTAAKNNLGAQLAPIITELGEFIIDNGDTIIAVLAGIGTGLAVFEVASTVMTLVESVKAFQTANEGASIAQALLNTVMNANPIVLIITLIAGLVAAIVTLWHTNDDFRAWVTNTWEGIRDFFGGLIEGAKSWGQDLIQNFINGLLEKAAALWDTVKGIAGGVKDFLGFSEPEKGPLSDFHTYGPDMMKLYAQSIRDNAWRVEDAVGELAMEVDTSLTEVEPAVRGGSSYSYGGFVINVYPDPGQDEDALADKIMYRIQDAVAQKQGVFS